jgi:hypothetical protein
MVPQFSSTENRRPFNFHKVYKYSRHKVKDSFIVTIKASPVRFFMNMSYPSSGSVALVSFIILGSYDRSPKAVDTTAQAVGIDDEALKIVNNFWTEPHCRDGMTQQLTDAIINVPHKRLLNEPYPSGVSCLGDFLSYHLRIWERSFFTTIRSDWEGS